MKKKIEIKRKLIKFGVIKKIIKTISLISIIKWKKISRELSEIRLLVLRLAKFISILNEKKVISLSDFWSIHPLRRIIIVVNSDLGLCGSFNNHINNFICRKYLPGDQLILIGKKARQFRGWPETQLFFLDRSPNKLDLVKKIMEIIYQPVIKRNTHELIFAYNNVNMVEEVKTGTVFLPFVDRLKRALIKAEKDNHDHFTDWLVEVSQASVKREKIIFDFLFAETILQLSLADFSEYKIRQIILKESEDNLNKILKKWTREFQKSRQEEITENVIISNYESF